MTANATPNLDDDYELGQNEVVAVIDNGTAFTKVGLSTDDKPTHVFPSEVGVPRKRHRKKCDRDFYCGDEVREAKSWPNIPLQQKFHRGVLRGVRNISDTL